MKVLVAGKLFSLVILFSSVYDASGRQGESAIKAIVGIVVENMRPDYLERYHERFGDSGFRKLCGKGVGCSDFIMPLQNQNSCSGIATLYTGVYPSDHGIIGNKWYDRKIKSETDCVADDRYKTTGSESMSGTVSPSRLRIPVIGDRMKVFSNGRSQVFSIAMNSNSSVLSAGFSADAAYWFDDLTGKFVSGSFYLECLPEWVSLFNSKNRAGTYTGRNWVLLRSYPEYKESMPDINSFEKGYAPGMNSFPHNLAKLVKTAGNFSPLKTTPYANRLITEFALELFDKEKIGMDEYTDLVTLVYSSMDTENSSFGPVSIEMEDLYLRLDEEVAEIISYAEKKWGTDQFVIFLTSNVSASYQPEYLKEKFRIPTGYFSPENATALLNSYLNISYGDLQWIEYFDNYQIYFNHQFIEANKVEISEIRQRSADFLSKFEGVSRVVTADQAQKGLHPETGFEFFSNSYYSGRSGDIMIGLLEGWQPAWKTKKNGGYTGQIRLPLFFYGGGLSPKTIRTPVYATDLVPTISEILGIPVPDIITGKIIDIY
jgi:hypothetical protein